jgi:hypothetical protein
MFVPVGAGCVLLQRLRNPGAKRLQMAESGSRADAAAPLMPSVNDFATRVPERQLPIASNEAHATNR